MNIYESISAAMSEGYAVGKNSRNTQQGFMYRGIDAVMNTFQPILSKHKIFVVPTVLEERREDRTTSKGTALIYTVLKIKYTFYAEDGTFVESVVIGEGMDSGDKSANKAMSVAMKYAMFQIFCIPTEEMIDPDGDSHDVAPRNPPADTYDNIPPTTDLSLNTPFCHECGNEITAAVKTYSEKHYGRPLCLKCQDKVKK